MNKTIITIVAVAIIAAGGYFLLRSAYQPAPPVSQLPSQQPTAQPLTNTVTYTDSGFSPSALTIKKGGTVTFKNESSKTMWTASAIHPTHTLYPATGGCISSAFDACKGIQPGDSWPFKFDIAGTWKYHNHLNPGDTGTIIVE
ncbi:MAG: cupredoxin domain-containing protein [Candidatus Harrisonbacteria bacterium]|nr:cupredoxin domain-containing protein [Candidatus Harrisonbacteria bacterium]